MLSQVHNFYRQNSAATATPLLTAPQTLKVINVNNNNCNYQSSLKDGNRSSYFKQRELFIEVLEGPWNEDGNG